MASNRRRDEELSTPPLANAMFAGEEAARTLAEQGIHGPLTAITEAKRLRKLGASRKEIHRRTSTMLEGTPYAGVIFGPNDNKPRFEISDDKARFKPDGMRIFSRANVADVLDHPELYKAVPSVGMTQIERGTTRDSGFDGDVIEIGKQHVTRHPNARQTFEPSAMGPTLHELQHDVQGKHKLNPGSSLEHFPGVPEAMQKALYRATDGENEAEMTRARQKMTPAERRASMPTPQVDWDSQIAADDFSPRRKQAFIGDLTEIAVDAWKRATTREIVEGRPIHQRRIDPRKVAADPETFQFKSGGDASGVTDRLKGVTQWDPLAAGKQVVYQRANGEYVIADGHQRRGLALRAIEGGQKGVALDAFVLREKDGWSPRDVRAYAALKNMKESSGNALDMAKVMRERPDLVGKSLPMSDAKIREAVSLSKLSAKAFDMVVGGAIKPEHAAAVGASVGDSARHADMLTEMAKAGMRSAEHARLYVQQAMASASISETTGSLFGDETKVRSLLAERAKVLDRALGALKSDKRIFAMLEREAANIEAAGNRLAHASNLEKADTAGRLAELVERLSTTRGPVSEMLDKAALAMAEGKSPSQAARGFVNDVGRTMKDGGINALTGNVVAPPAPVDPVDPNQMGMFGGDEQSGKPQGWSDEAREASAKVRKGKAKGKQPKGRGRKQMMIEDGRPAPSKDIDAGVARGQNLKRASGAESFADGWKAAKDGRRLPAGVDPDFAAGYRQYQTDKSPRAAERAMVEYLAGQKVPGTQEVTLAGKTKPGEQGSFLPEATTKEKIAAAAKAKGRPSAAQQPMDDGMFGSGMNQTDLVEMAKKPAGWSDAAREASADARKSEPRGMDGLTRAERSGKSAPIQVAAGDTSATASTMERFRAAYEATLMERVRSNPSAYAYGADQVPEMARKMTEALAEGRGDTSSPTVKAVAKSLGIQPTSGAMKAALTGQPMPVKAKVEGLSAQQMAATKRAISAGASVNSDALAKATNAQLSALDDVALAARRGQTGGKGDWSKINGIEAWRSQIRERARATSNAAVDASIAAPNQSLPAPKAIMDSDGNKWVNGQGDAWSVDQSHKAALTQTENSGKPAGWSDEARKASAEVRAATAKPLKDMSLKELRAEAKAKGVSLGGAKTKAAIASKISRASKGIVAGVSADNPWPSSMTTVAPRNVEKAAAAAKAAAAFDPHAVGLVPTAQREGPAGLAKAIGGMSADQARATAKAQGIHVPASIKTDAGVREFVARATFKQMADRRAAAGGDPSKLTAMADEAGNALRGTQNAANREAIAKNRKAKAKDLPREAAIARFAELMNGKPNGPWTTREINRAIRDQEATLARRAAGKDAAWSKAMAAVNEPHAIATKPPHRADAQHQAALTQTQNQPPAAEPAKPAPKSKAKARAGKVAGIALGPVALGAGIAAAAVIAANTSAEAGQSKTKQAASATVAAAQAAAPVAVIGGGLAAGVKLGLMTAGRAALVGTGIGAVAIGISAAAYGAQAAKEGKGKLGIAKAAAWGAINGVVPIDAVRDATRSTAARVSGTPARPSEKQMGEYVQANNAFQRQQAMNTTQTDQSDRKPGWSPEARIAAAKSRGAALPYGGNPAAAPGYIPPKTHNGKAA